jgi:hypothetical protein
MHTTFSQLDRRTERNQQYQRWLNCEQVLPGHVKVPPPPRIDLAATVKLIRELLPTSYTLQIDVSGDLEAVDLIRAKLSPEENARVQFSTR